MGDFAGIRMLSDEDVSTVLDLDTLLVATRDALIDQFRGRVVRPDRPHYPIGAGLRGEDPLGTGLVMPAYIEGAPYAVTKLATVHEGNPDQGLPTVHATIAVTDAETGQPVAYMDGQRITNARTGCIGGVAADAFTEGELTVGVLGAGTQARWQTRAIAAACPVDQVRIYSPSDSRDRCAVDLRGESIDAVAVHSPAAAVSGADVVVTATTSTEPTFDGDDLPGNALVVAIGAFTPEMRELDRRTLERASVRYADVPEEALETGDIPAAYADALKPLGSALAGQDRSAQSEPGDIIVVKSVGTAALDAAVAATVLDAAIDQELGQMVPM